jgi:hypothetical protein
MPCSFVQSFKKNELTTNKKLPQDQRRRQLLTHYSNLMYQAEDLLQDAWRHMMLYKHLPRH